MPTNILPPKTARRIPATKNAAFQSSPVQSRPVQKPRELRSKPEQKKTISEEEAHKFACPYSHHLSSNRERQACPPDKGLQSSLSTCPSLPDAKPITHVMQPPLSKPLPPCFRNSLIERIPGPTQSPRTTSVVLNRR